MVGSCDKKALHKTWVTVCILIGTNSDLHYALCIKRQTGLSSGTKFLGVGKGVTVFVLEICLSEKALMEVECYLETAGNGRQVFYDFVNW